MATTDMKTSTSIITGNAKWDMMYLHLVEYKNKHGNCLVPNRYKEMPQLGSWVSTQRRHYKIVQAGKESPLTQERLKLLIDIGFVWATKDPRHVPWEKRYQELLAYKEKYGDCLIPVGFEENPQLANWVSTQRQEWKSLKLKRQSRLTQERITLLTNVGFVWEGQRGGARKRKKDKISTDIETTASARLNTNTNTSIPTAATTRMDNYSQKSLTVDTLQSKSKLNKKEVDESYQSSGGSSKPWIAMFKDYLWFQDQHKNPEDITALKEWAEDQRKEYQREKTKDSANMFRGGLSRLTLDQFNLLQSINFDWNLHSISPDGSKSEAHVGLKDKGTHACTQNGNQNSSSILNSYQINQNLNCRSDTTDSSSGHDHGEEVSCHYNQIISSTPINDPSKTGAKIEADAVEALFSLGSKK